MIPRSRIAMLVARIEWSCKEKIFVERAWSTKLGKDGSQKATEYFEGLLNGGLRKGDRGNRNHMES